jgi:beta-lactamase class A
MISIVLLALTISLIPSYRLWTNAQAKDNLSSVQLNRDDSIGKTEILVEMEEESKEEIEIEDDLMQIVQDHFGDDLGKIGFYYEDLATGAVVQFQADQQFRTASVSKMIVLMALMDRVSAGSADLNDLVVYSPNDFEWGSGVIAYEDLSQPNLAFDVGTLAEYAVVYSDNIAFNMLWRYLGTEEVYTYFESIIGHETNRGILFMSAEDASKLMKLLYVSEGEHYDTLRENLKNTIFPILLEEYLPAGTIAHKVGFYLDYLHDSGIVYTANGDYVISVFSIGLPNGYESIAELSLKIYESKINP